MPKGRVAKAGAIDPQASDCQTDYTACYAAFQSCAVSISKGISGMGGRPVLVMLLLLFPCENLHLGWRGKERWVVGELREARNKLISLKNEKGAKERSFRRIISFNGRKAEMQLGISWASKNDVNINDRTISRLIINSTTPRDGTAPSSQSYPLSTETRDRGCYDNDTSQPKSRSSIRSEDLTGVKVRIYFRGFWCGATEHI